MENTLLKKVSILFIVMFFIVAYLFFYERYLYKATFSNYIKNVPAYTYDPTNAVEVKMAEIHRNNMYKDIPWYGKAMENAFLPILFATVFLFPISLLVGIIVNLKFIFVNKSLVFKCYKHTLFQLSICLLDFFFIFNLEILD